MTDFYVDERTGRVHRILQTHADPETSRLERRRRALAKARRAASRKARKLNRR